MKIILVATNAWGKNLVFVTDTLGVYSLPEALQLVKDGKLENLYSVNGRTGAYLRTKSGVPKEEQLDRFSVSSHLLFSSKSDFHHALSTPAFSNYWLMFQHALEDEDGPFIMIEGSPMITKGTAQVNLLAHRDLIFAAAKEFDVDPYLLGAIIIDEIARLNPIEEITDRLAGYFIGVNTSIGIAQVETDTARDLIRRGYYNPDPNDSKLSPVNIQNVSRSYLYQYIKEPKHGIFFAAARMRALIDEWRKFVDIGKRPEIIATLYSLKHKDAHSDPKSNDRGLQITKEFYPLAKEWLH